MSCTVKISSKGWSGSQRRIGSLPEETTNNHQNPNSSNTSAASLVINNQQNLKAGGGQRAAKSVPIKRGEDTAKLLKYIDDNVIGKSGTFFGPFGRRKVVYCDYTASGRSLQFLEEYIAKEVLPCLGDTRASTSICSLQSSLFRHEARDIVRHAVGAGEQDAVLFTGHGTDDALRTLLRHLDLPGRPMIVFVGPFEHHANLRPWREHGSKVVRIGETKEGFLDLNDLEKKLSESRTCDGVMIGCFSAASCITGVLADDVATTLLLHQYGALSIWDYTSAAPFVQMDMNPHVTGVGETAAHKDVIIFSGHKFVGGAQSPSVLVIKRSLLTDGIAAEDMRDSHRYHRDPELRGESGTAGVVETIRCGLAVQLKENVTPQAIVARQDKISKQVLAHVRTIPELILLGNSSQNIKRLPIFSFMVRHPRGTFLHHNFVCAILNDVFGIQARGGCACAGRYAHHLMGIDTDLARKYEKVLVESNEEDCGRDDCNAEALRPGFARLSLPYFMSEAELAFVLEALKMVATEGWKLLPQYVLNPDTGEWRHHTNSVFKERKWLGSIRYTDGKMVASERRVSGAGGIFPQSCGDCLQTARNIFNRSRKMAQRYPLQIDRSFKFSEMGEKLRWFMLPGEAQDLLLGNSQNVKQDLPFDPTLRKCHGKDTSSSTNSSMRRLNSDIPRSSNQPGSITSSPRHHSLPALSITRQSSQRNDDNSDDSLIAIECNDSNDGSSPRIKRIYEKSKSDGMSSCSSRAESPAPAVKFAVGEVVTSSVLLGTTPGGARILTQQHSMPTDDNPPRIGRARCNSLGSSATGTTMPVPIPLSPQTLASLGLGNSSGSSRNHRNCRCSSRMELSSSLEFDATAESPSRSPLSSANSSPTSSSSPSPHPYGYSSLTSHHPPNHHQHGPIADVVTQKLGRSSPILSSFSQSSEDDLRAYLKEVTKELATEIKSEIREVISKVDDVLSESNSSDVGTPQHHSQRLSSSGDKNHRDDSFSASEIAEYLMEFSKEMASEVKSEIRCMVNAVDGLGRYSPDPNSTPSTNSPGYKTPERRSTESPQTPQKIAKAAKLNELLSQQQESKMSSECSSDETVIYVIGPRASANVNRERAAKTSDEEDDDKIKQSTKSINQLSTKGVKTLPEIYSAINSVSSQDSGINLSFHDNDVRTTDLGRSSSSSSGSSAESCGINFIRKCRNITSGGRKRDRDDKLPNDLSEDENVREDITLSDDDVALGKEESTDSGVMLWHSPSKSMWKPTVEAIHEYDMIRDKDRVLVCLPVSTVGMGVAVGKYSLALLHTLHQYQFYTKSKNINFEVGTVTINSGSTYDPIETMSYLKKLDVPYYYEEADEQVELINSDKLTAGSSDYSSEACTSCGRVDDITRKRLYSVAKRYGYNVLAFGQHIDDLADDFLSSLFCTGKLKTMKAHYYVKEHDLRVIRPFVYVRERALRQFTEDKKLPMLSVKCEACEERAVNKLQRNRELLAHQERSYPRLYWSLRTALKPLILARNSTQSFSNLAMRQRQKIKSKNSQASLPILATSQELADSESDDDDEQII